jgi:O-antigen/teichoic acid export membrane protein
MRTLLSSVLWRYLAIAIQFGVVILIAHHTEIHIAGMYFALFGFVTVAVMAVGLGIPDGLVRHFAAYRLSAANDRVKSIVVRSIVASVAISGLIGVAGYFIAKLFFDLDSEVTLLTGVWWLGYALTFIFAQIMVALGRPAIGVFVLYSSVTIGYAFTLVPFILIADNVTLKGLLYAANAGAWSAALVGSVLVARSTTAVANRNTYSTRVPANCDPYSSRAAQPSFQASEPTVLEMLLTGFPMMLGRFMQASLPWIPVWVLITLVSADEAAIYSAASRLTVAVTSVVAALRFSIRPAIVELNTKMRYADIVSLNRKCSMISAVPPVAGIIALLISGHVLIPLVLGHQYVGVDIVLLILMFGVLAEAFGGMSDEILKMTGRTYVVICTLVLAVLFQLSASYYLAPHGASAVAFATAIAFAIQYVGQVLWLSLRTPIRILPLRMVMH